MYTLEVSNPVALIKGELEASPMATRPDTLNGKTIGLVWNGKANGDVALKYAAEVIEKRIPNVRFKFYSGALPCSQTLMEKAKTEVDLAIGCTAD